MAEFDANVKVLDDTIEKQNQTKDVLTRIQRKVAEAEGLGEQTYEELRRQGQQMDDIDRELEQVSSKLDQSQNLQNRFDKWAGNWFGGKKRAALKEASAEIVDKNNTDFGKVREVYEQQRFNSMSRTWKASGLVLGNNPTVGCDNLFDPIIEYNSPNSSWKIDFSRTDVDNEGWTYCNSFTQLNKTLIGDKSAKWNSYVRRRLWIYTGQKSTHASSELNEIQQRNTERKLVYNKDNRQASQGLTATGYHSAQKKNEPALSKEAQQKLDQVNASDKEMDMAIDSISTGLDRLNTLANAMKDETNAQTAKLDKIEASMQKASEKQAIVNARARMHVKSS